MENKLLTRDEFREGVFKRDEYKCVICKDPAKDAHHILDRKLFEDGGYYLNNGASLCEPCHKKAEETVITCEEIRIAAGIKIVMLPDDMDPEYTYDKWGKTNDLYFSRKYGRTYHYPFSPGTTSDDRINHVYWNHVKAIENVVHTEKMDGENTCISKLGVFARSHAAPTLHKWADYLKIKWSMVKNDLNNLEIFGENLYAIHSIKYVNLEDHFQVFGIRCLDKWLSWEETKFYASLLDFKTVPEIAFVKPSTLSKTEYEGQILNIVKNQSTFGSLDSASRTSCRMEGIVTRNVEEYAASQFKLNVFKYVRKDHVKTDVHWSAKPKRATLLHERPVGLDAVNDEDKIIKV